MCIYIKKMRPSIRLGITWSLNELQKLVNDENACVRVERSRKHISLHPIHLNDITKAFQDILESSINIYDHQFKGLLLAYKNPKLISELGSILHDSHFIHVDIVADFYIFEPQEQRVLTGVVNKKANNYLGVLVHKVFNVSIPKRDEESWEGNNVEVGDDVTFIIEHLDLKGKLPYIRGKLLSSSTPKQHTFSTPSSHKFFDIDNESEDTFNTVNETEEQNKLKVPSFLDKLNSSSSDEEAQTVNEVVKKKKHKVSRERNSQNEEEIQEKSFNLESTISTADDEHNSVMLNGSGKSKKSSKKHKKSLKDKESLMEDENSMLYDDSTFNQSEDTSLLENGSPRKKSKKRKHEDTEESSFSESHSKIRKHKKKSKKNDDDDFNLSHEVEKLFSQNIETDTSQAVDEESTTQKSKKHKRKIEIEQNDFNEIDSNSRSFISDFDDSLNLSQGEQPSKSSQKNSKHKNKSKVKEERPDSQTNSDNNERNSQIFEPENKVNGITKSSQSDDNQTDTSFNYSIHDRDESQKSFNEFEKPTKSVKKKKRSSNETVLSLSIKEEPESDLESISSKKSKKRKRKDRENTDDSLNDLDIETSEINSSQHKKKKDMENEPVDDVSIGKVEVKQEVVIKEEIKKKKKHRESNQSTSNIKQESPCSNAGGTAVKKKIRTLFTE